MGRPPNRDKYKSAFGKALGELLGSSPLAQADLARGSGVSASYLNKMMTGTKPVPPDVAEQVSTLLNLDPKARSRIHAAAARSAGYKVDIEPGPDDE